MRMRVAAVGVVAVLAGCSTTPAPLGVVTQSASPRREALQYFPADAPVVTLIHTDPTDPALRRLLSSGVLAPLSDWADAQMLRYPQYRSLLGNDAVVGQPHVGGPPLVVLVTSDREQLQTLVESRVVGGLAIPAGDHRGADLYAARGWAFAIRGPVLLVGTTTTELKEALDTRTQAGGFEAAQLTAVLPDTDTDTDAAAEAAIRGRVDVPALAGSVPPALRGLPVLRAVEAAELTVDSNAGRVVATLTADTEGTALTGADLPSGRGTVRMIQTDPHPLLSVADLGAALETFERALRVALPVSALKFDALEARLRAAGVELTRELLAGDAWLFTLADGPRLVWHPADMHAVRGALARVVKRYRAPGLQARFGNGFYTITQDGRLVARLGIVGKTIVAGQTSAADLRTLVDSPIIGSASGGTVLRIPRPPFLRGPLTVTLGGDANRVTLRATLEP